MNQTLISNKQLKSIARWMVLLFILAWVNLAIQAPVHAAMKQNQKAMPCHCQPNLCDTVLSLEQQSDEALSSHMLFTPDFQVAFISQGDIQLLPDLATYSGQLQAYLYRQTHPPPLLLKTVLLI